MENQDSNILSVGEDLPSLRAALIKLHQDYDAHTHDGASSKSFKTIQADTFSSQVMLVRKTSYSDIANGIWYGLSDNLLKLNLGNSTDYLKWTGSSLEVAISGGDGISITQTTVAGGVLKINPSGQEFYVGNVFNASIALTSGTSLGNVRTLTFQLGTISTGISIDFNSTADNTGDFSPPSGKQIDLGRSSRRWNILYCASVDQTSDRRLKTEIRALDYGLSDVIKMNPVKFKMAGRPQLGFLADELAHVVPEITSNVGLENEMASIRPIEIIPILVKAIQELSTKVNELENKIKV